LKEIHPEKNDWSWGDWDYTQHYLARGAACASSKTSDTEGPPHPMSTQNREKEGSPACPESVLRLRKGHMPVTSEGTDSQHDQYDDTCVLLAGPPPSAAEDN
ncbi:unnamed protein product, partial [Staurois parvus]